MSASSSPSPIPFKDVALLPEESDNAAIACKVIHAGTPVLYPDGRVFNIETTVLEGHRFAVHTLQPGEQLLSWGLPFGRVVRKIEPGQWLCNTMCLKSLAHHDNLGFTLPTEYNFVDDSHHYVFDESKFVAYEQVPLLPAEVVAKRTWEGYARTGGRGVGTRNILQILPMSPNSSGFALALEAHLREKFSAKSFVSSIAALAHTEGATIDGSNIDMFVRTLAGFLIHPNAGAVLLVDAEGDPVTTADLLAYAKKHNYPIDHVPHASFRFTGDERADIERATGIVEKNFAEPLRAMKRTPQPLSELKVAQQCGGSDAFSGVSANPLAGWVARKLIQYGGQAQIAETDELVGAESYILARCSSKEVLKAFLDFGDRFKAFLGNHGVSVDTNPSGGNIYRGLYNIILKSVGAAKKKHAELTLDGVLEYAERMPPAGKRGYYFMDSPGNDIESLGGQVASGCNLILFSSGNGSFTNNCLAPTLKLITTAARYRKLAADMDFNAGRIQEGVSFPDLTEELFDLMLETASGKLSKGEIADHSQVQIWRNWSQRKPCDIVASVGAVDPDGLPLTLKSGAGEAALKHADPARIPVALYEIEGGRVAVDRAGLVLPTSLCSSMIAAKIAKQLHSEHISEPALTRFLSLPHTEGCGSATVTREEKIFPRTLMGHVLHSSVSKAFILEHGCEKLIADYFASLLEKEEGVPRSRFGWGSLQGNGLSATVEGARTYFNSLGLKEEKRVEKRLSQLAIGIVANDALSEAGASALAHVAAALVASGSTVVVSSNSGLATSPAFAAIVDGPVHPTIPFGKHVVGKLATGIHVMEAPAAAYIEQITGLVATGVHVIISWSQHPVAGSPLAPVVIVSEAPGFAGSDVILRGEPNTWPARIFDGIRVAAERGTPKDDNNAFQATRGLSMAST